MKKINLNNSYKAVVIGGSAGSFQGVVKILAQLPKGFPLPIIMCLHRL
ncbi:MAG: chemotaxis protein CheB, partial [Marivirga sp.]|nr:chemotaxis protein CheB [Marivirga sp.]